MTANRSRRPEMQFHPIGYRLVQFLRQRRLTLLGILIALGVIGIGATVYFVNASATPPSAADARIRGLVAELNSPVLTPARQRAQQQLEQAGPAAVDPLVSALRSSDPTLRSNSAEMLGYIASPRALDALSNALAKDTDATVRAHAAWALGELNDLQAFEPLERAAVVDADPQVRQEAGSSLNALRVYLAQMAGKPKKQVAAFAVAPGSAQVVYLGALNEVSTSRDGGATWTALATTPSRVTALAVSPADPNVIYAGTESLGLYKSSDGGATWVAQNRGLGLAPGVRLSVTALAIDPQNPDRVYAARGAWVGASPASLMPMGAMLSVDGGASWQAVNLPTMPEAINRLVIIGNTLYASAQNQIASIGI
jgi:HEAT repeats